MHFSKNVTFKKTVVKMLMAHRFEKINNFFKS